MLTIEWLDGERSVELFDLCGSSLGTVTGSTVIDLDGVSFVQLKGEGILGRFEVVGFSSYEQLS